MKTLFTIIIVLFLFASSEAKVVYLNNELSAPVISENLYTNWADAYAAVSAGDTIYVYGSNFDHGHVSISKRLTIIGPGYFLDENLETQVEKKMALFNSISLETGSDGSVFMGVSLTSNVYGIKFNNIVENITIAKCYISNISFTIYNEYVYNNIIIKGCYFYSRLDANNNYNGVLSNLVFANNIINGSFSVNEGSSGIISNNIFLHNTLNFGTSSSFEIYNNIFLNTNTNNFTIQPLPDAAVHHNISLTGAFGNDNNNFIAPLSTLFNTDENASTDAKYQLSQNSPAKGAGSNGSDIGAFGGPVPYRLSGLPNLPNIYELSTTGLVSGDVLPVHIKIKQ
ncbi:hypothetical protein SAMN06265379_102411 [Saccharicrinis carchari]|uniref:Right handed beta helix region n=1 Tax=Saccharicrinis carchari TaxID=1168039 RepID=A0A521C5Y0_SACCC|nr:hypothetical protein [Saccharicrinis carchari]SMO54818.1 hypothetical protein SAMN06265379_102411 [Saccharicrinis carchari]